MKALLLLLLSGLKWGKLAASGGSMLLSLVVYATIWGWRYAAGFIALLFAHEMGHYVAARQRGLDVGAPAFIPFMGAFIALKDHPEDVETEAYVAIAGPVAGTVAALAVYLWARSEDSGLLLAIAYSGLFLNLFNLLPVSPLDGGRVTVVLSPRIWFVGVPILLALMLYRPSPMLLIVAILAAPQLLQAWRYDPHAPENIAYYGVPLQTKLEYGAAYLGLAALLAIMTYDVHEMLSRFAHPA
ncbi:MULTISPECIES: site-2 protease family protein [unclassified Bradyrhizobium]|uniref:site-2 protease family protein n=1 Tax=unclassified Bradyrhizobium TaxID=2631580 RepID=UPI001BA952D5|nr:MULTISPECIES: site-2 protease family protein [unclassified Bradyrhizobium]MBR1205842.1 site-2 protease family protein [Bradyrhizobium sp. AUGA SZCCT0124]MBR1315769.1 site-2 protease family protein [Bradyrhizobium sp. AUGA SZCCT0051]MBR1338169.1 site-2 protease family protein [Bradyrhizobium sp. AUGA SZCCT0105]MBR1355824.1 site-2 protease family protein [Bradyrhizobium sp. AUGA SZCCT0045]